MNDKKNIDRLFQEKFKDFEVSPDEKVWGNIAKKLEKKSKKGLVIPLWFKVGGVAALLALMAILGNEFLSTSHQPGVVNSPAEKEVKKSPKANPSSNEVTREETSIADGEPSQKNREKTSQENQESNTLKNTASGVASGNSQTTSGAEKSEENSAKKKSKIETTSPNRPQNNDKNSTRIAVSGEKNHTRNPNSKSENTQYNESIGAKDQAQKAWAIRDNAAKQEEKKKGLAEKAIVSENTAIKNMEPVSPVGSDSLSTELANNAGDDNESSKKSLAETAEELAKNSEDKPLEDKKGSKGHWVVSPNISPIYSSSFNGGNAIDPKFNNNKTEGEVTMAYGVNFAYAISNKIKVRSGISRVNVGHNINNVAFSPTISAMSLTGLKPKNRDQNIEVLASTAQINNTGHHELLSTNAKSTYSSGSLQQEMGYIEVPLEVEYALLDHKFGINLIGGASTLFLNKNNIFINSEQGRHTKLGEANNLNNVSFTTNIGVGFNYQLTQQLKVNVEPTFKYQLNTFSSNSNGFNPYYFGVYTGLSFAF